MRRNYDVLYVTKKQQLTKQTKETNLINLSKRHINQATYCDIYPD